MESASVAVVWRSAWVVRRFAVRIVSRNRTKSRWTERTPRRAPSRETKSPDSLSYAIAERSTSQRARSAACPAFKGRPWTVPPFSIGRQLVTHRPTRYARGLWRPLTGVQR
jgi:hypothetical protein